MTYIVSADGKRVLSVVSDDKFAVDLELNEIRESKAKSAIDAGKYFYANVERIEQKEKDGS